MKLVGKVKFVGSITGVKNDKRWMNVVLDDMDNLMERVQLFVSDETLQHKVMTQIAPGDVVNIQVRVSTRQRESGSTQSVWLEDIFPVRS